MCKVDLIGIRFKKLIVIERDLEKEQYRRDKKLKHSAYWKCKCDCGNEKSIRQDKLLNGSTVSCGCYNKIKNKKYNEFYFINNCVVGITTNTAEKFFIDLEDYEKIKNYCWREDKKTGYIVTNVNGKSQQLQRFIMNVSDDNLEIDHKFHNLYDQRKKYLRIVTHQENMCNTDAKGIWYRKDRKKWIAEIHYKHKKYTKEFFKEEDAITQRKVWEAEFFGDFNYQEPPPEYIEELERLKQQVEQLKLN